MTEQNERMLILEMIESGSISAADGVRLLQVLSGEAPSAGETALPAPILQPSESAPVDTIPSLFPEQPEPPPPMPEKVPEGQVEVLPQTKPDAASPRFAKWRSWWMIPLWVGLGITALGGVLIYFALQTSHVAFWFVCASLPFAIGLLVMFLAWQSRKAPWLHLRVQQPPGETPQRIAFSFPIPVRPAVWFLRVFGNKIPDLEGASLDEILLAVGTNTSPDNPIYIEVDEGEQGEKVEIYIG